MLKFEGVFQKVRKLDNENLVGIPLYQLGTGLAFGRLTSLVKNPNTATIVAPTLARDISSKGLQSEQPVAIIRAIKKVQSELRKATLPYHNYAHSADLNRRIQLMRQSAGPETQSSVDWNMLTLAAWAHDLAHSGSPYRQLQQNSHAPTLSNEEYACIIVDNLLQTTLGTTERLILQGLILATSFGQTHTQAPNKALVRRYRPYSPAEHILALADIGAAPIEGFDKWCSDAIKLGHELLGHTLDHDTSKKVEAFICSPNHENFFDLIRARLECLVNLLPRKQYNEFSDNLTACRLEYQNCMKHNVHSLHFIRAKIGQYFGHLPNAVGE